ncbi:MAG: hypothetical protein QM751_02255 [Paludibacteraceae bacterium]
MNFRLEKLRHLPLLLTGLLLFSCNTTKYIPDGEYLLNKVSIKSDTKAVSTEDIQSYLRQTPNSKLLGLWRTPLGVYNLAGKDSTVPFIVGSKKSAKNR